MSGDEPAGFDLSVAKVQRIEARIRRINETMDRVTVDCTMRFTVDREAVQDRMMDAAVRRMEARRSGAPAEEEEGDDDDDECMESDRSDSEDETGAPKKRRKARAPRMDVRRFVLYVGAQEMCTLSPWAKMQFVPKPGTTVFPFRYADLQLRRVLNSAPRVMPAARLVQRLRKVVPWAVPFGEGARQTSGRAVNLPSADEAMVLLRGLHPAHAPRLEPLLRDIFRAPAFYALLGAVDVGHLRRMADARCHAVLEALVAGDANRLVFDDRDEPLQLDLAGLAARREFRALQIEPDADDTAAFAAVVGGAPDMPMPPLAPRGRAFAAAAALWRGWRMDGERMQVQGAAPAPWQGADVRRAAVGYLVANGSVALAGDACVPRQLMKCMVALRMLGMRTRVRIRFAVCTGSVAALPARLPALIGQEAADRAVGGIAVLCPTMQVCKDAWATTGWDYVHMPTATDAETHEALAGARVVVLAEAHLFAVHEVAAAIRAVRREFAASPANAEMHVILTGCAAAVRFAPALGIPFPYAQVLAGVPSPGQITMRTDGCITREALESSRAADVAVSPALAVRLIEVPAGDAEKTLSVANIATVLLLLIKDCAANGRPPFLAFDSRYAMEAVMASPLIRDYFPRDTIAAGAWAEEPDGGVRRIESLWLASMQGGQVRAMSTVQVTDATRRCIRYALRGAGARSSTTYAQRPVATHHHCVIGEARFAPCDGLTFIAVFARRDAAVRAADLRWLEHVARGRLVVVLADKPRGLVIDARDDADLNVYDLVRQAVDDTQ